LFSQPGIVATYFDGANFNRQVGSRLEQNIDLSWNQTPPIPGIDPHDCSIRWTGRLLSPATGVFTFSAKVDDGIRVWVGNLLVIDAWNLNDEGRFNGKVKLEEGKQYDLKVEYFNALIEGEIRLLWQLPDETSRFPKVIEPQYFLQTPKPVKKTPPPPLPAPVEPQKTPPPKKQTPSKPKTGPTPPPTISADTIEKYIPQNVHFEKGKAILLGSSYSELDRLAAFLVRNPDLRLTIEGHTDVIGDWEMNMTLSQERADMVAKYIAEKGVDLRRMAAKGYGGTRPLVKQKSKEGNSENRRVAFIISR
jgi:outer membrane protein OmpA-like peptidoglycan-associated protein